MQMQPDRADLPTGLLACVACVIASVAPLATATDRNFAFRCERAFTPDATAESLAAQFGTDNFSAPSIDVGEGFHESGSVLFADDPLSRVEILWKDALKQESPRTVRVRGSESRWHTVHGFS